MPWTIGACVAAATPESSGVIVRASMATQAALIATLDLDVLPFRLTLFASSG
jgi:hypothetical protein